MIRVAATTRGRLVPSARFRVSQYRTPLIEHGVLVTEFPARTSASPPASTMRRPLWAAREILGRASDVVQTYRYDAVVIQREFISTFPTLEWATRRPRILDVDDAIWLHRGGLAADTLARWADHVVCGNEFLANYFKQFGREITVIPTAVDIDRFKPAEGRRQGGVIGWSGSSSGLRNLRELQGQLKIVLDRNPDWRLRVVSDQPPTLPRIPADRIEYVPWSPATEVDLISTMDIGLMPLEDSDWSRGKCSYKMLLYLACAVPAVVSEIGMNQEILRAADVGLGVKPADRDGWVGAIDRLVRDSSARRTLGENGRKLVAERFSVQAMAARWSAVLHRLVN